jgi:hypothetical protein
MLVGMTTSNKKTEGNPVKKITVQLLIVALSIMALLTACDNGNADTDTNPSTNPSTNEQDLRTFAEEAVYGTVYGIDGMKVTINASNVMVFFGSGGSNESIIQPDGSKAEEVKEDTIIRVTEETEIEVRTSRGGQIIGTRAGTMDDFSLQDTIIAEGAWEGDEFVATVLVIFKL